jgi:modulator of FtsH protease
MSNTLTYQQMGTTTRGQTHTLFAQTMGYVAATAALFALGAWAGHDLTGGVGIVAFIAASEPVKLNETSGGWITLTGLLGLDGGAGLVDPHLGWQGRG